MLPLDDKPFTLTSGPTNSGLAAKDELNLAEFPIALVTDRIPAGEKTLKFEDRIFDERKGQVVTRRLVITASDEYGLPTAKDDEVIVGLIQLTRSANNFSERTVRFSRSDLIRLLSWPDTGPSYRRLGLSFHRWLGVSLHYDNAWWDKAHQQWTTLGFHILESFKLAGGGVGSRRQLELPLSRFTWNEDVFRSFRAGYLKQLDLDFYLGLELPTAKRMYRFLDKRFYHRSEWVFDLKEFALDHVGLSRKYEGGIQLIRKLESAIRELEEKGFLEPLAPDSRFERVSSRRWRVRFVRRSRPKPIGGTASGPSGAPTPELIAQLIDRGVTPSTARDLVTTFPEELVREKVEVHDWLIARKDRRVLRSPAGFLVQSIRNDYAPPQGFESKAEGARRRAAETKLTRQSEEARKRLEAEEEARERAEKERVEEYWSSLGPLEQNRLWEDALASANAFFAQQYRRHEGKGDEHERRYRELILHCHILEILDRHDGMGSIGERDFPRGGTSR